MYRAFSLEFQDLIRRIGVKGLLGYVLAALVFGYVVPARFGLDFLDVFFLLAYACLPCIFVAPAVADAVAGWRPGAVARRTPAGDAHRAQVLSATAFAFLWGTAVVVAAIVVANLSHKMPRWIVPSSAILINTTLLGASLTFFAAASVGWLALNSRNPAEAKNGARRLFLLILLAIVMWARMAPAGARAAVESRFTPDHISLTLLPISAALLLAGAAIARAGASRRAEDAAGPLFKL